MSETAQCWTWSNQDIRFQENYTLGRPKPDQPGHKPALPLCRYNTHGLLAGETCARCHSIGREDRTRPPACTVPGNEIAAKTEIA